MDIVLWILIGLPAGFAIAALAPEMGPQSMSASGRRRVRDMAAGMIGAVAVAYAFIRFHPAQRIDGLTSALAALAGALWVAGMVEVYSSRRRQGEASEQPQPEPGRRAAIEMPAYDAARQALVAGLIEDAMAHEAGRYTEIGRQLPAVRDSVSRQNPSWNSRLQVALRFWRGWTEARDKRWRGIETEQSLAAADWPRLARTIASDLALDRDTMEPAVIDRFAYATPWATAELATAPRAPLGRSPQQG